MTIILNKGMKIKLFKPELFQALSSQLLKLHSFYVVSISLAVPLYDISYAVFTCFTSTSAGIL